MSFRDRVIAISGAGSGIGLGIARHLISQGAYLSLADKNLAQFKEKETQDDNLLARSLLFEVDVRNTESVNKWMQDTVDHYGKLHGAVNCAGILGPWASVSEKSDEEWDLVLDINLGGTFRCLRAQLLHMSEGGSVVNLTSVSGLSGLAFNAPYCASKHAIIGLTKSAAKEVASRQIRVNCLAPGVIETPMLIDKAGKSMEQLSEEISGHTPLHRMGTVQEAANAIAFLPSESSSFTTGSVLTMDGGMSA